MAEINPIAEKILAETDPSILETLSPEQLTGIRASIDKNMPQKKKHAMDVRGTIPFFFGRIYFVISFGKDKRKKEKKDVPFELRTKTTVRDVIALLVALAVVFSVFGLLILAYVAPLLNG